MKKLLTIIALAFALTAGAPLPAAANDTIETWDDVVERQRARELHQLEVEKKKAELRAQELANERQAEENRKAKYGED